MIRPWLTLFGGLLVSTSFATVAWSQARQPTLAERMAALRRGWTKESPAAQKAEGAPAITPIGDASAADGEPQEDGGSLIPGKLFNRGPQRAATESSQQNDKSKTRAGSAPSSSRVASRIKAGVTPSASSPSTFTLPGLGGSPLPSSDDEPQTAAPSGDEISREFARDYPVVQPESRGEAATQPGATPAPSSGDASSSVRHSPHLRGPIQVDPSELRRELSGTFTPEPTANDATSKTDMTPANAGAELPVDLPVTEEPVSVTAETSASASPTSPATDVSDKKADTLRTDEATALGAGLDTQPGVGAVPQGRPSPRLNLQNSRHSLPLSTPPRKKRRGIIAEGASTDGNDAGVLASNQAPVITTDIRGPRQILVGREATYRVQIRNQGEIGAERIVASVQIPSWAEVVDTSATQGAIQQPQKDGQTEGVLEWQLAQLDAHAAETLDVRLIPKSSRPLELGVTWTVAPVGSRAVVEVQEPKLQMSLSGPDDVLYDKPQLFRLTLTNPGTGVAEGVQISLVPPGASDDAAMSQEVGDLAPGTSRSVEVELTAREAGKLNVKASASAAGGLMCDTAKEVFCRKPELEVDWRGPEMKYAGTDATYFFRVRNPGTAAAEDVSVVVSLPEGAELKTASEGQAYDAKQREIAWRVGTLGPGDDSYMELRCVLKTSGVKLLRVTASTAVGELSSTKQAETNVVALADLKLDVSDPVGPVAVGEEAIYEIRVQNRGANVAKDVNIVALFSEGIEPDQVEGALYNVADGRVSFKTIEDLPAGRQIVLRIRAHALTAGTHVFRAEVLCRDLETKLAAEETTRYYADDAVQSSSDATPQSAGRTEDGSEAVK